MPTSDHPKAKKLRYSGPNRNIFVLDLLRSSNSLSQPTSVNTDQRELEGRLSSTAPQNDNSVLDEHVKPIMRFIIPEHINTFKMCWHIPQCKTALLYNVRCDYRGESLTLYELLLRKFNSAAKELGRYCFVPQNSPPRMETGNTICLPNRQQSARRMSVPGVSTASKPLYSPYGLRNGPRPVSAVSPKLGTQIARPGVIHPLCDSPEARMSRKPDKCVQKDTISPELPRTASSPAPAPAPVDDNDIVYFDRIPELGVDKPVANSQKVSTDLVASQQLAVPPVVTPLSVAPVNHPRGLEYMVRPHGDAEVSRSPKSFWPEHQPARGVNRVAVGIPLIVCDTLEAVAKDMFNRKIRLSAYDNDLETFAPLRQRRIHSQPVDIVMYHVYFSSATFINSDGEEQRYTKLYHFKKDIINFLNLVQSFYDMELSVLNPNSTSASAGCYSQTKMYKGLDAKEKLAEKGTIKEQSFPCNCKGTITFQYSTTEMKLSIYVQHKHHKFTRIRDNPKTRSRSRVFSYKESQNANQRRRPY